MKEPTEFQFSRTETASARSPLSLALLFYIVTTGAILSACLSFLAGNENVTMVRLAIVLGVGGLIGLILGLIIGILQLRVAAAFIGGGVGLIVGLLGGALSMIEPAQFTSVTTICFAGCLLLVASMLVAARLQHDPSLQRRESDVTGDESS
ncbi:MAG: hypothetical protein AAF483_01435 [Planctomycetota bacterium]